MTTPDETDLIDRLRKIEALFARPGTEGERAAAKSALERIRARLQQIERSEPPIEYQLSVADTWSRMLLRALLRRYGLRPYRYRGQRRTTVMVKVTRSFLDSTLWPEFEQLDRTLRTHLDAITQRIIREAICEDVDEAEERAGKAPQIGEGGDVRGGVRGGG